MDSAKDVEIARNREGDVGLAAGLHIAGIIVKFL
jgi:hypothetical protein